MPLEPLPWDRKDFFKERKHERSEALGSVARWRDSSSYHGQQREFNRWGSADFCRHPGHGKQGGWHLVSEDCGHSYAVPRSCDKMVEDDTCRPSIMRGEGKYGRNSREYRGTFSPRDWKGHSMEIVNGSPNTPGRPHEVNNDHRSADDTLTCPSHAHFDIVNSWDQLPSKDQHDKMVVVNGSGTSKRYDKENQLGSLEWKTLKWARSGSLSSRGSGFSHSSSSKSMGGVDSNEAKVESHPINGTPVQSPSGDAATCVTSAAQSEETSSRKKPRLKWGEGLAKYEKKKVDVPDEGLNRNAPFSSSTSELVHAHGSNLSEKSPRVSGFSDCASPATPSSVACSSSPGLEDKSFVKAYSNDVSNLCMTPRPGAQNHIERFPFNLEKLDISSIANIGSSLTELLQLDDPSPVDSSFMRSTAMSKLLLWKSDISKVLEVTETEIDMLENELKSLKSESGGNGAHPAASSSLPVDSNAKAFPEQGILIPRPAPLQIICCGDTVMEETACCNGSLEEVHANVKGDEIDSPGTATSKFVEPLALMKAVSPSGVGANGECARNLTEARTATLRVNCWVSGSVEYTDGPSCKDGNSFKLIKDGAVSVDPSLHADGGNVLHKLILASNKESAVQASEVFNKLLPSKQCKFDMSKVSGASICLNESLIREKFATRKHFLRFKERAITLKFKALRHLWKEDLHVLSIRKYRAKAQRKFESSLRIAHGGCHKHRSFIRSRPLSPAGNLSMAPTSEIINFTSKMRLDSQVKLYRNVLKMPALILDKKEREVSRFITSNGLVEDPCAIEKERFMINPWTSVEKEIFLDKLAIFGKDFKKIASFLEHKTTADCVEFYYKNHKSDCFKKTKKKMDVRKQGKLSSTYLMTSGKKWNREMNVASLDMLGSVSLMAAHADSNMVDRHARRFHLGDGSDSKISRSGDVILERSSSLDLCNERETAAADVLAGICGSVSSEAMGSCITSSIDPAEGCRDSKYQKVDSTVKRPFTPDVTQNVDDETWSNESCGERDPVDWTDEEKSIFVQAVSSYGKDFLKISRCVRTKSKDQCKVFFSKARKCLGLDLIHPSHGDEGTPVSDDANGGGSDPEYACLVESGSVVCSDKSSFKMDEEFPSSIAIASHDEPSHADTVNKIEQNCSEAFVTSVPQKCEIDDRPVSNSDGDKSVIDACQLTQIPTSAVSLFKAEGGSKQVAQQGLCVTQSVIAPCSSNAVLHEAIGMSKASIEGSRNELECQERLFSGSSLDSSRDENCNAGSSDRDSVLQCSTRESNAILNTSHLAAETSSCSGLSLNSDYGLQSNLPSNCISLQQESSIPSNSLSLDSAVSQCEKNLNQDRLSSTRSSDSRDKQCQKSISRDGYLQNLSGHLLNRVESSPILKGYPLQMHRKEMNGDLSCVQLPEVQGLTKSERSVSDRYLGQDCYLQKCSNSSVAELSLLPQNSEQASGYTKTHSRSLSDTEKPSRNGDVKLFGKILTTTKQHSNTQENNEKVANLPKLSSKPSSLKLNGHHGMDGNSFVLKFDRNNYLGLENIPMSNGFWDGRKIQTSFTSLPDSAILLAKYPAAFANYPASSKMEQQSLQTVVRSNDRSLNGVSVFPTREISSSNTVDYQVYRSLDGTNVHPFTVDMKQRQDMFSEMPRRNGFEAIPSLQQQQLQGRGMVGMNIVGGGGGIIVGGVSDPVAAIKMHYARTEQYRENESWRGGDKDVGR